MKIGILGSGNIGGTLGTLWLKQGHEVFFAVRDHENEKAYALLNASPKAQIGTVQEAVTFADIILLAVHWQDVPKILEQIQGLISDKILIDATNRMLPPPSDTTGSAGQDIARLIPEAKFVKAFNTLGANNLTNLKFGSENASTFICGDDLEAKTTIMQLATEIGFDAIDVGDLSTVPLVESLTKFWVRLSRSYGREIAFKLLRR